MKKIFTLYLFAFSFLTVNSQVTASWTALTTGTTVALYAVSAPSATICYVAGAAGTIKKTLDGGMTWSSQSSGSTQDLYNIHFTDLLTGYVVGDGATAKKTINGGTTWIQMTLPVSGSTNFRFVYFTDPNTGYITGGPVGSSTILKTTNAGTTWTILPTSSVSAISIYSIFFTSPTEGYAVDYNGKIIKTTNSGSTWTSQVSGTTSPLYNIYFTSSNSGFAISRFGDIRSTNNAGATWSGVTSGTSDALLGMDFYDNNHGFIVGGSLAATSTGIILSTTDGGITWTASYPGTERLYRVDLVSPNVGYAVGLNGKILKYDSNIGIIENEYSTFICYPNPFSESTTIDCSALKFSNTPSIEVYDVSGKLINSTITYSEKKFTVKNEGLTPGNYVYRVLDGNSVIGNGQLILQ